MEEFKDYLFRKLNEFERNTGHRISLEKFAEYIGVSRPSVSLWLQGKVKPSYENAELIAEVFGIEVYEILGFDIPDPNLTFIKKRWHYVPKDIQNQIAELVGKYSADKQP